MARMKDAGVERQQRESERGPPERIYELQDGDMERLWRLSKSAAGDASGDVAYLLATPARERAEEMERALEEIADRACVWTPQKSCGKAAEDRPGDSLCASCIARTALAGREG